MEDTVQAINDSEKLTTLRLSGNSMGVQASMAIAGALTKRPTLRRALWSDMFVGRLKSEIPPAVVRECTNLFQCTFYQDTLKDTSINRTLSSVLYEMFV